MNCPHCGIAFHDTWEIAGIKTYPDANRQNHRWHSRTTVCPTCFKPTIELYDHLMQGPNVGPPILQLRVYPQNTFRKPTPAEVPPDLKEDYEEASKVLPLSSKASAALSRRCLQALLRAQGYPQHDLARQIDALLAEPAPAKAIPSSLRETVDAVRNFGNFSAHRITDQTTLQVIDVEENEAEWCLDILDEAFDHYYVRPAQARARKATLDAKLSAAGKPPSK
jgi:hypothetical protein